MQVRELIEALRRAPPDAVVVVGGDVIHGVELRRGHLLFGYSNPQFRIDPYGKDNGVVFLHNAELSTGEMVSVPT